MKVRKRLYVTPHARPDRRPKRELHGLPRIEGIDERPDALDGRGVRCSVSMAGGSAYSHGLESASPPFTASRNILWSVTDMSRT